MNTALVEEVLRTAKVTVTLFTNTTHKENIANRFNLEFLQSTQYLQDSSQAAGIVTDAWS